MGSLSPVENQTDNSPTGKAVLLGLDDKSLEAWSTAAGLAGTTSLIAADVAACEGHALGETPVVIVAHARAFDPRLADPSEPAFNRTTLIVVSDNAEELSLWGWVAWGATSSTTNATDARTILAAASQEATHRRDESELIQDFRRRHETLNTNEQLAFKSICAGRLNKQIANDFGVSVRTVEQRRRRLFEKMGVETAVPLAALAAKVQTLDNLIRRYRPRVFVRPPHQEAASSVVPRPKLSDLMGRDAPRESGVVD